MEFEIHTLYNFTNLKLSICQPVFFAPAAKLIEDFHQRLSTLGQRILYLGRDLRILLSHNELIHFQFFEIATKGLIRNRSQIAFHFIEPYRLKLHQAIQNNHLMLAADKGHGITETSVGKVRILNIFFHTGHIYTSFQDSTCLY